MTPWEQIRTTRQKVQTKEINEGQEQNLGESPYIEDKKKRHTQKNLLGERGIGVTSILKAEENEHFENAVTVGSLKMQQRLRKMWTKK